MSHQISASSSFFSIEKRSNRVYNLANKLDDVFDVAVSRIVTKNNRQFFTDFVASWSVSKTDVFNAIKQHKKGGEKKAQKLTKEYQQLMDDIKKELDKNE